MEHRKELKRKEMKYDYHLDRFPPIRPRQAPQSEEIPKSALTVTRNYGLTLPVTALNTVSSVDITKSKNVSVGASNLVTFSKAGAAPPLTVTSSQVPVMVVNPMQHVKSRINSVTLTTQSVSTNASSITQTSIPTYSFGNSSLPHLAAGHPQNIVVQGSLQNNCIMFGSSFTPNILPGGCLPSQLIQASPFQSNVLVSPYLQPGLTQGNLTQDYPLQGGMPFHQVQFGAQNTAQLQQGFLQFPGQHVQMNVPTATSEVGNTLNNIPRVHVKTSNPKQEIQSGYKFANGPSTFDKKRESAAITKDVIVVSENFPSYGTSESSNETAVTNSVPATEVLSLPKIENYYSMKNLSLKQIVEFLDKGHKVMSFVEQGSSDYFRAKIVCEAMEKHKITSLKSELKDDFFTSLVSPYITLNEAFKLKHDIKSAAGSTKYKERYFQQTLTSDTLTSSSDSQKKSSENSTAGFLKWRTEKIENINPTLYKKFQFSDKKESDAIMSQKQYNTRMAMCSAENAEAIIPPERVIECSQQNQMALKLEVTGEMPSEPKCTEKEHESEAELIRKAFTLPKFKCLNNTSQFTQRYQVAVSQDDASSTTNYIKTHQTDSTKLDKNNGIAKQLNESMIMSDKLMKQTCCLKSGDTSTRVKAQFESDDDVILIKTEPCDERPDSEVAMSSENEKREGLKETDEEYTIKDSIINRNSVGCSEMVHQNESTQSNLDLESLPINPVCSSAQPAKKQVLDKDKHAVIDDREEHDTEIQLPEEYILGKWDRSILALIRKYSGKGSLENWCYLCGLRFPYPEAARQHIATEHGRIKTLFSSYPNYSCTHCYKMLGSYTAVKQHEIDIHLCEFPCYFCGLSMDDSFTMLNHVATEHSRLFICDICGTEFLSVLEYKTHCKAENHIQIRQGIVKTSLLCLFCHRTCANNIDLAEHLMKKHIGKAIPNSKETVCTSCRHPFLDAQALLNHRYSDARKADKSRSVSIGSLRKLAQQVGQDKEVSVNLKSRSASTRLKLADFITKDVYPAEECRELIIGEKKYVYPYKELHDICELGKDVSKQTSLMIMDELIKLLLKQYPKLGIDTTCKDLHYLVVAMSRSPKFTQLLRSFNEKPLPWTASVQDHVKSFIKRVRAGNYYCAALTLLCASLQKSLNFLEHRQCLSNQTEISSGGGPDVQCHPAVREKVDAKVRAHVQTCTAIKPAPARTLMKVNGPCIAITASNASNYISSITPSSTAIVTESICNTITSTHTTVPHSQTSTGPFQLVQIGTHYVLVPFTQQNLQPKLQVNPTITSQVVDQKLTGPGFSSINKNDVTGLSTHVAKFQSSFRSDDVHMPDVSKKEITKGSADADFFIAKSTELQKRRESRLAIQTRAKNPLFKIERCEPMPPIIKVNSKEVQNKAPLRMQKKYKRRGFQIADRYRSQTMKETVSKRNNSDMLVGFQRARARKAQKFKLKLRGRRPISYKMEDDFFDYDEDSTMSPSGENKASDEEWKPPEDDVSDIMTGDESEESDTNNIKSTEKLGRNVKDFYFITNAMEHQNVPKKEEAEVKSLSSVNENMVEQHRLLPLEDVFHTPSEKQDMKSLNEIVEKKRKNTLQILHSVSLKRCAPGLLKEHTPRKNLKVSESVQDLNCCTKKMNWLNGIVKCCYVEIERKCQAVKPDMKRRCFSGTNDYTERKITRGFIKKICQEDQDKIGGNEVQNSEAKIGTGNDSYSRETDLKVSEGVSDFKADLPIVRETVMPRKILNKEKEVSTSKQKSLGKDFANEHAEPDVFDTKKKLRPRKKFDYCEEESLDSNSLSTCESDESLKDGLQAPNNGKELSVDGEQHLVLGTTIRNVTYREDHDLPGIQRKGHTIHSGTTRALRSSLLTESTGNTELNALKTANFHTEKDSRTKQEFDYLKVSACDPVTSKVESNSSGCAQSSVVKMIKEDNQHTSRRPNILHKKKGQKCPKASKEDTKITRYPVLYYHNATSRSMPIVSSAPVSITPAPPPLVKMLTGSSKQTPGIKIAPKGTPNLNQMQVQQTHLNQQIPMNGSSLYFVPVSGTNTFIPLNIPTGINTVLQSEQSQQPAQSQQTNQFQQAKHISEIQQMPQSLQVQLPNIAALNCPLEHGDKLQQNVTSQNVINTVVASPMSAPVIKQENMREEIDVDVKKGSGVSTESVTLGDSKFQLQVPTSSSGQITVKQMIQQQSLRHNTLMQPWQQIQGTLPSQLTTSLTGQVHGVQPFVGMVQNQLQGITQSGPISVGFQIGSQQSANVNQVQQIKLISPQIMPQTLMVNQKTPLEAGQLIFVPDTTGPSVLPHDLRSTTETSVANPNTTGPVVVNQSTADNGLANSNTKDPVETVDRQCTSAIGITKTNTKGSAVISQSLSDIDLVKTKTTGFLVENKNTPETGAANEVTAWPDEVHTNASETDISKTYSTESSVVYTSSSDTDVSSKNIKGHRRNNAYTKRKRKLKRKQLVTDQLIYPSNTQGASVGQTVIEDTGENYVRTHGHEKIMKVTDVEYTSLTGTGADSTCICMGQKVTQTTEKELTSATGTTVVPTLTSEDYKSIAETDAVPTIDSVAQTKTTTTDISITGINAVSTWTSVDHTSNPVHDAVPTTAVGLAITNLTSADHTSTTSVGQTVTRITSAVHTSTINTDAFSRRKGVVEGPAKVWSTCDVCLLSFDDKNKFTTHCSMHTIVQVRCKICLFMCGDEFFLELHKAQQHSLRYRCKCCGRIFEKDSQLTNHIHIYHDDKVASTDCMGTLFSCTVCSAIHFDFQEYEEHLKEHFGRFVCQICGTVKQNKQDLDKHYFKSHQKFHKCSVCNRQFLLHDAVVDHLLRFHPGKCFRTNYTPNYMCKQ